MSLARAQAEFLDAVLGAEEPAEAGLAVYHRTALASRRSAIGAAYPLCGGWSARPSRRRRRLRRAMPSASGDLTPREGFAP